MSLVKKRIPPPPLPKLEISSIVNKTELCLGDELKGSDRVKSFERYSGARAFICLNGRCHFSKRFRTQKKPSLSILLLTEGICNIPSHKSDSSDGIKPCC